MSDGLIFTLVATGGIIVVIIGFIIQYKFYENFKSDFVESRLLLKDNLKLLNLV